MRKKISLILVMLVLVLSILGTFCYASEIQPRTGTDEGIATTSEINQNESNQGNTQQYDITYEDLYVIEDKDYEMDKLIDGNAYILVSGNVKFSGEVNGSAFILSSGTVEFTEESYIADSLYICAQEVKVNGSIYDIYGFANKFETMQNAYISRDIRVAANDAKLRGTIYRNVNLSATNIDVKDETTSLLIGGDFNYTSTNKIEGLEDVVLYGEINFNLEENEEVTPTIGDTIREYVFDAIASIIYALAIFFILKLLSPRFTESVGKDLKEKGIPAFGVGILVWIIALVAFIISIMILFTEIGFPISIIAWVIMFIVIYISSAVLTIAISEIAKEKIPSIKDNKGLEICAVMVIALVLWILQQIPFIGGLCSFVILTTGLGLIVRNVIARKNTETVITEVVEEKTSTEE